MDPSVTQAVRAASGIRSQASWYGAEDRALEQFSKQEEDMAEVSMERHGRAKQLVVFFGAASISTKGGWGADAVMWAYCKPEQGALPAKGKEYPGLGYKCLRDKPPKAQQQQQQRQAAAAQ
ncbi:hypothetical protein QJQ45_002606 [Haematococcus lacustris]|nr:hypothetical protein QJQ45_002605 [Haematococcus lacustris]KAJ9517094.1 hypothetical protein QJQ45_002606 [Haematococcus lacustris]